VKTIKQIELKVRRERLAESKEPYLAKIAEPKDVARIIRSILMDTDLEKFLAVPLDVKNRVLGYVEVAKGSVDLCVVGPRDVFRAAIVMGASGIIVAHNHPSGDISPSPEDTELTKKLCQAGELLGLPVLDHVIVAEEDFFSFAEKGLL
jgi:DNA repair protein RadC